MHEYTAILVSRKRLELLLIYDTVSHKITSFETPPLLTCVSVRGLLTLSFRAKIAVQVAFHLFSAQKGICSLSNNII